MKKYYKILGLNLDASLEEVEKRYNELLNEFDPNKYSADLKDFYQKELHKVQEAYKEISLSLKTKTQKDETNKENSKNNHLDSTSDKTKSNKNEQKVVDEISNKDVLTDDVDTENISNIPLHNTVKKESQLFRNILLFFIAAGVWGLFMQNMGLFVPSDYNQVRVVNTVDTEVVNSVRVNGSVDVDNTVDINISQVNGYSAFYRKSGDRSGQYYRLPVSD